MSFSHRTPFRLSIALLLLLAVGGATCNRVARPVIRCHSDDECSNGALCIEGDCFRPAAAAPADCPETLVVGFAPGSKEVPPSSRAAIAAFASCHAAIGGRVGVAGHGDGFDSPEGGRELAAARATAVASAFAAGGWDSRRIQTRVSGNGMPLCKTDDAACRAKNARVQVELLHFALAKAMPKSGTPSVSLVKYPTIDPPPVMRPNLTHTVHVSLEDKARTPTIVTGPGGEPSPEGKAVVTVPEVRDVPEEDAWKIDVQLDFPGGVVEQPIQSILLRKSGPADVAQFKVKAAWTPPTPTSRQQMALLATFSREGKVIARAIRLVTVTADESFEAPAAPQQIVQGGELGDKKDRPDLFVQLISLGRIELPEGGAAAITDRFVFQAQLTGTDAMPVGADKEFQIRDLDAFLSSSYRTLSGKGRRSGSADPTDAQRDAVADAVRDFGDQLWKLRTSDVVKERIRMLQRAKPRDADIRFQTNDPRFPLELLLVPVSGNGDCGPGVECELLGVLHRVSRWHAVTGLGVDPTHRTRDGSVALVAPRYQIPLDAVVQEGAALARLSGDRFKVVPGKRSSFIDAIRARPIPAVLHYAGHGAAHPDALPGIARYSLKLEDEALDLASFRQNADWLGASAGLGPLVFLNACEVGQASGAYGWVDGWGPAALERGAAGYIGGLWELGDVGAATFAERFYAAAMAGQPVGEAMRAARSGYRQAADPTFAAYVYYGHPDLLLAPVER
jgi:hypothetical protein